MIEQRTNRAAGGALRTLAGAALLAVIAPATATAQMAQWGPVPAGYPQTAAELNGFSAHTRHLEMWDYLNALSAASPHMRLTDYGETWQGRKLPMAVFSRPLVTEPWEAWALDRPIVVLAANVHGGERTFREGLLVLMRDLATPGTEAYSLLDRVTVVVAPQVNPDGFEASQGGTRGNAWGIDLNRDYVKLEHPSIINYIGNVTGAWRPHMYVDGHNGGSQPYNLNYQCPSHFDPAQEITLMCDREIFPAIDAKLATEGMKSWYYTSGNEERWRVGGQEARIGRNYGGFVNSAGILFEAPRQDLETGARAGYLGYLAVVQFAAENAEHVKEVIRAARMETYEMGAAPRGQIAVQVDYEAEDYPVSYEIVNDDDEVVQVTGAQLIKKPVATLLRDRPWAYLLPRDAREAVEMLKRHGIVVERLTEEAEVEVQAYEIGGISHESAYNHEAATVVEVAGVVTRTEEFPEGTFIVPTAQFLGRLAAHMLEPESDDNVVYWNTMDAWIPRGPERYRMEDGEFGERPAVVPIYKLMTPTALRREVVKVVR